jgi:hypothetical protein
VTRSIPVSGRAWRSRRAGRPLAGERRAALEAARVPGRSPSGPRGMNSPGSLGHGRVRRRHCLHHRELRLGPPACRKLKVCGDDVRVGAVHRERRARPEPQRSPPAAVQVWTSPSRSRSTPALSRTARRLRSSRGEHAATVLGTATGAVPPEQAPLAIFVRGCSGCLDTTFGPAPGGLVAFGRRTWGPSSRSCRW